MEYSEQSKKKACLSEVLIVTIITGSSICADAVIVVLYVLFIVILNELIDRDFELGNAIEQFRLEFRLNGHEMILHLCRLHQTYSQQSA